MESDGSYIYVFIDGVLNNKFTWVASPNRQVVPFGIGSVYSKGSSTFLSDTYEGKIDELRFSNGIKRFNPVNFTPPTEEYLTDGPTVRLKYYDGAQWIPCSLKYHNGASWVEKTLKYYNGSEWTI
jgi:hypothetical protein